MQHELDEIVVGLTGYGQACVDRQAQPFGPGAVVYLPLGSTLELINEAPDKLMNYLIIKAQAAVPTDELGPTAHQRTYTSSMRTAAP